jgi:hypothetical protein
MGSDDQNEPSAAVWDRMSELPTSNPDRMISDLQSAYHRTHFVEDLVRGVVFILEDNSRRLDEASDRATRDRLLRERAKASLFAGRLTLFDTWAPVVARGYLTMACDTAVEAGDDALAAGALGHLAFVLARENLASAGAGHLQVAREYAERAGVPALVSWVGAVEAEILGALLPDGGQRVLDDATVALDREASAAVPVWFDYYSAARLDGFRGQALLAAGQGPAAREALTRALADLEPGAVKQRAVLLADLAASCLCGDSPDVEQAAAVGLTAVNELGRTCYQAATERLAGLRARLEPWCTSAAVRALDEALAERGGDVVFHASGSPSQACHPPCSTSQAISPYPACPGWTPSPAARSVSQSSWATRGVKQSM